MTPPILVKMERTSRDLRGSIFAGSDAILVGSLRNKTIALERDSFAPRWIARGTPQIIVESVAVLGYSGERMIAHAVADGKELWRIRGQAHAVGAWKGRLLVSSDEGPRLVRPGDGAVDAAIDLPWAGAWCWQAEGDTLVAGESLPYGSNAPPRLCAIDLKTGALLWDAIVVPPGSPTEPVTHRVYFHSPSHQDNLYLIFRDAFYCLAITDGSVRWQRPVAPESRFLPAGDWVLKWDEDHLAGYDAVSGTAVFDLVDNRLVGLRYPILALVHQHYAVILFWDKLAVIDMAAGKLVNLYTANTKRPTTLSGAAVLDGSLVVVTPRDLRVFDESIWTPSKPRNR